MKKLNSYVIHPTKKTRNDEHSKKLRSFFVVAPTYDDAEGVALEWLTEKYPKSKIKVEIERSGEVIVGDNL